MAVCTLGLIAILAASPFVKTQLPAEQSLVKDNHEEKEDLAWNQNLQPTPIAVERATPILAVSDQPSLEPLHGPVKIENENKSRTLIKPPSLGGQPRRPKSESTNSARQVKEFEERLHELKDGDTLEKLAVRYWKDESLGSLIFDANRDRINDPKVLPIGVVIVIPRRP